MTSFRSSGATGPDWRAALGDCLASLGPAEAGENLGLVYVTEPVAPHLAEVIDTLKRETGIADWAGAVALGVGWAGAEYYLEPAICVLTSTIERGAYRVIADLGPGAASPADTEWARTAMPGFGIVHADCASPGIAGDFEDLAAASSAYLVGGLTMSAAADHQVAGGLTGGGISGVLFAPGLGVATALTQGCQPIGPAHTVTECMDNIVVALDGRPALEVFKDDLGPELAADLENLGGKFHAALPVPGSDTGDYVVRNLIGIDEERAWVAIAEPLDAGDKILFVRHGAEAARADLAQMLEKLINRLDGPPKGALYISCIARGPNVFGAPGREMGLVADALGDVPLIGFYANGEISLNRIYSYTGVLTLFV